MLGGGGGFERLKMEVLPGRIQEFWGKGGVGDWAQEGGGCGRGPSRAKARKL